MVTTDQKKNTLQKISKQKLHLYKSLFFVKENKTHAARRALRKSSTNRYCALQYNHSSRNCIKYNLYCQCLPSTGMTTRQSMQSLGGVGKLGNVIRRPRVQVKDSILSIPVPPISSGGRDMNSTSTYYFGAACDACFSPTHTFTYILYGLILLLNSDEFFLL